MKDYLRASEQWSHFLRKKYKKSKELTRLHHNANIDHIRAIWTEKGQTDALPLLTKLEKEMKGQYSLQMIFWLYGKMAEEKMNYKKAVEWLTRASKQSSITADDERRILWNLAWNLRRTNQYKKSQSFLERLVKRRDITFFEKSKYLYWKAENLKSMKIEVEARKAFDRLAKLDLFGYYGSLAHRSLGRKFSLEENKGVDKDKAYKKFNNKDKETFRWLSDIQEYNVAGLFLKNKVPTRSKWSADEWAQYLWLLQEAGAYRKSFYRYHSLKPKNQLAILKNYPALLFPRPYPNLVDSAAKKSKVSPSLIYSIMKQESGFDPRARSFADAFGLLQLIPQVAKISAQRRPDVGFKKAEDLFNPEVNIPLGADVLSHLLSNFNNQFVLSVASYNSSKKAAQRWVRSRFSGDPVTFIEDIPYEETKGYVKLVLRNYIAYNRFASKQEVFKFPEVCLDGLQAYKN